MPATLDPPAASAGCRAAGTASASPTADPSSVTAASGCVVTVSVTSPSLSHTLNFVIGSNQAVPWLETAVVGLRPGDSKTATDASGAPCTVVVDRVTPPSDGMPGAPSREELFAQAESMRVEANDLFAASKEDFKCFKRSMLMYNRALDAVRSAGGDPDIEIRLRNNLALCSLRTAEWTAAIVQCDAVLEISPGNAKALYRRALAEIELDMFVRALQDLREAHRICPDDKVIKKELERVEEESKKTLQKRRQQFAETYNFMPQGSVFSQVIPE